MKKILAFAGSNSSTSINRQLVRFAASFFEGQEILFPDLNDFEMPIYSADRERLGGIPQLAYDFAALIDESDLIMISLAEHNGAYSTAFKNIFDWVSRIPGRQVWAGKSMFLLSTSPGPRGGASVMEIATNRFPRNGGKILETFSLPEFDKNFSSGKGITDPILLDKLEQKIKHVLEAIGS